MVMGETARRLDMRGNFLSHEQLEVLRSIREANGFGEVFPDDCCNAPGTWWQ